MSLVIGLDIGGTKTSAGVVDVGAMVSGGGGGAGAWAGAGAGAGAGALAGAGATGAGGGPDLSPRWVAERPTPGAAGREAILTNALDVVKDVLAAAPADTLIWGLGVGAAGVINVGSGAVISSTDTLAGWAGTPLAAELGERISDFLGRRIQVHVLNDADAHLYAEATAGAARGAANAILVAVGTGVGASLLLNGRIHHGAHHVAGEIGHLPVPGAEGLRCPCGQLGHLEAIASGVGMVAYFHSIGGSGEVKDARKLERRALNGDALAHRAFTDAAVALGRGLAGVVSVIDPEIVVLGGGLIHAGRLWWDTVEEAMRTDLIPPLQDIPLRRAETGRFGAIIGAAAALRDAIGEG